MTAGEPRRKGSGAGAHREPRQEPGPLNGDTPMHKVRVTAELTDQTFRAYESEARRRGIQVETLLEQTVNGLLKELESEERDGTDHLIVPS